MEDDLTQITARPQFRCNYSAPTISASLLCLLAAGEGTWDSVQHWENEDGVTCPPPPPSLAACPACHQRNISWKERQLGSAPIFKLYIDISGIKGGLTWRE